MSGPSQPIGTAQGLDDLFRDHSGSHHPLNHPLNQPLNAIEQPLGASSANTKDSEDLRSTAKARYLCNWNGCDQTFSRTADRDRHLRTKHNNARKYHCREPRCNKGVVYGKGYSRVDKLQEHMRKKHPGVPFRGTM